MKDRPLTVLSKEHLEAALRVADRYDQLNANAGRELWTVPDFMAGFMGDVGDLSKLIMAKAGKRSIPDLESKLAHELADCLWSILVISHKLDIDLNAAFENTMAELNEYLDNALESNPH